ncbi:biliverdin-producing heme oxygenase [Antarcticibacterium sp. 1MA-6-2]|uniref:biliverdin-producing heme oxygenase n=1 Tax=Antarcticibacterium sp. 1MA-6-2 TaxID=2908210 RepID=UPI001F3D7656|nr:biliverdin-producing heme oxygenase [Antarcticibacterium sp. 1MA-6-2]UJH91362.1 biliverdin-producing heme oxygenase [Antarcticibacterium sp. 1MA-6-2]
MLERLREETKELHREIEKGNLAEFILSHTITRDQYKLLLLQNYIAYSVTEGQIKVFLVEFPADKCEQLQKDLEGEGVDYSIAKNFQKYFSINNRAEAIGAAYVVEGSSLGGMMISQQIAKCPSLSEIEKHHFFSGNRQAVNGWKQFCKMVKKETFSASEEEQAVQKARETFQFFGKVFSEVKLLTPSEVIPVNK